MKKRSSSTPDVEIRAMTKRKLFFLKNEMLGANFVANLITVAFVQILILKAEVIPQDHVDPRMWVFDDIFTPSASSTRSLTTTLLYGARPKSTVEIASSE